MGFAQFNPFKRDRQNFPGVVIPLSSAPAHPTHDSSHSEKKKKKEEAGATLDDASSGTLQHAPSAENGTAGSIPETSHLTIEILRKEIDEEVAAGASNSMYDRMCPFHVLQHPMRQFCYPPSVARVSQLSVLI